MPNPPSNKHPAKRSRRSAVQAEIAQGKPFGSLAQEATIALLRTASVVSRAIARVVEPSGLSLAQYNALRIVRGAGAVGIATLAIRDRMIEEGTTITRLLDKLDDAGLLRRERSFPDRRQVTCHVTDAGRKLLDRLDPQVDESDAEATAALTDAELERFIEMLDAVRAANAQRGAARSSSGRAETERPLAAPRGLRSGAARARRRPAPSGTGAR